METEKPRVNATWKHWEKCSGMFCERRMPVKLKWKIVMLYLATTKGQEATLEKSEPRRLVWMYGVTKKDKIRKEYY